MTADEQAPQQQDPAKRVIIFDTTLRDGEQSPGIHLNTREKVEIGHQLARLGVDVIEAGFPISSPGDFEATSAVAEEVSGVIVAALSRANEKDVTVAGESVRAAEHPRIHTFIATSDIHMQYKLRMERDQVLAATVDAVRLARSMVEDVEFSCEDATRSDRGFVAEVIAAALEEGATTINIPDTVGYTMPTEFQGFLLELYERVPQLRDAIVSVHCHNDLGLAVANSLAGVQVGARQVEGCINGIGERAGNASLEEVAMILRTRADALGGLWSGVVTPEITRTSRLVSRMVGYPVQPNKAIVGRNAFAHEAGIHQHGMLSNPLTYEIMDVASVGLTQSEIVLGKHSGRHALRNALEELGYELDRAELDQAFARFKDLADRKGRISASDLEAIVSDEMRVEGTGEGYRLDGLRFSGGIGDEPRATVSVSDPEGGVHEAEAVGDGPVDAVMKAIDAAVGTSGILLEYHVTSVTSGKDALGEARVVCEIGGRRFAGQSVSTDVMEASAIAYVRAVNASRHAEHGERVAAGGV